MSARKLLLYTFFLFALSASAQRPTEAAIASSYEKIETYFEYGKNNQDRFEKGRYLDYSIKSYKKLLSAYPRHRHAARARYHLAYSQQSLGYLDDAVKNYRLTISTYKNGNYVGKAARQLAYIAEARKKYAEAAEYFKIAAQNISQEALRWSSQTKRAQNLILANQGKEAIKALQVILGEARNPHREWARFSLGYRFYLLEEYEQAIAALAPLITPDALGEYRGRAMFYSGLSSAELGDADNAVDFLEKTLELPIDPTLDSKSARAQAHSKSLAQTSLMGMALKKQDYQAVINYYRRGDFGARGITEARRSLRAGDAYYQLKNYRNARTAYSKADRALPNTNLAFEASAKNIKCDYHLKNPALSSRVDAFLEIYAKSNVASEAALQEARYLKAETLYEIADYNGAAKEFSKLKPSKLPKEYRPQILFKHGWASALYGDHGGAVRHLSKYLHSYPEHPDKYQALAKRGESYLALGDRISALKDFETILKNQSAGELHSFSLQKAAIIMRLEKNYPQMILYYTQLLNTHQDLRQDTQANAHFWIGWGNHQLEKYELSNQSLQTAISLVPEFYAEPAGTLLVSAAHAMKKPLLMRDSINQLKNAYPTKYIPEYLLTWLGAELYRLGHFSDSARFLTIATASMEPKESDIEIWRFLAKAHNETGQYENALPAAKTVLKFEKRPMWKADANLDLAQANLGIGKIAEAKLCAEAGLAIDAPGPHLAGLQLILGKIALAQKDYTTASQHFKKTIDLLIDDPILKPLAYHLAAQAAEKQNSADEAAAYKNQLTIEFPNWKAPVAK